MSTRKATDVLAVVVGLIVLYILSYGPVAYLIGKGYVPEKAFAVYEPVQPLMELPVVGKMYTRYIIWWQPRKNIICR